VGIEVVDACTRVGMFAQVLGKEVSGIEAWQACICLPMCGYGGIKGMWVCWCVCPGVDMEAWRCVGRYVGGMRVYPGVGIGYRGRKVSRRWGIVIG